MKKNSTEHGNSITWDCKCCRKVLQSSERFYKQEKERNRDGSDAPDPDSYVFGPPGSGAGSVIYLQGSESGSSQHAKKWRNLISNFLRLLFDFLSMKNYVNVPSKRNKRFEGHWRKEKDPNPDPLVKGTDPRIRIPTKMSRIRNTAVINSQEMILCSAELI